MSCRITRSATSSWSVGSRLMMTSLAAQFLAISGNPAAGHTTSDDPDRQEQIALLAQVRWRGRIASSGIACPNEIVAVLTRLVALRAIGRAAGVVEARFDPRQIVRLPQPMQRA